MLLALVLLQEVQNRMEQARNQNRGGEEEESDQEESADGRLFYLD